MVKTTIIGGSMYKNTLLLLGGLLLANPMVAVATQEEVQKKSFWGKYAEKALQLAGTAALVAGGITLGKIAYNQYQVASIESVPLFRGMAVDAAGMVGACSIISFVLAARLIQVAFTAQDDKQTNDETKTEQA
jgi:hypothetical protein